MNWLDALMRPDLRSLPADRSARADSAAAVALDANESPWPPFGKLAADDTYNRYPDPQPPALRQRLAEVFGLDAGQILLGRGSGEGIDALLRLFCRANQDQILICPPTFAMYEAAARLQGAETLTAPLGPGGQLDLPAILRTCTPRTKLIFIPSPNAPMGHLMSEADMTGLCAARAGQSLVVIDEAYIEFSDRPAGMLPYLKDHPNLVILRTLSNAHALAGERVGCVIGAPDLVQCLARILAPYPLPRSSIRAAIDALSPNGLVHSREHRRLIVSERARMSMLLPQSKLVEHVFPSSANFLLIRTADSAAFMEHLRRYGIRARCCDGDIPNTVRLSIGTPEENILVLACLGIEQAQPAAELTPRLFSVRRATRETAIDVTVNLDSPHFREIETGIGFFDHMLAQLAAHGGFGLALRCAGDLHIDQHHSVEDCALALGEALKAALGDKRGIARFGFTAPLDEALAEVVVDLSGRPYFVFTGTLPLPSVGGLSSDMVPHFFGSLSTALNAAIYVKVTGENTHHMVEACFKAAGRALRQAFRREGGTFVHQRRRMIAVVDSGVANLASVTAALRRLGAEAVVTSDAAVIAAADRVILPGVGSAAAAMAGLGARDLVGTLRQLTRPVLGICLGMQLLFGRSEEGGGADGLAVIPGTARRLRSTADIRVPHMGWNTLKLLDAAHPLLQGIADNGFAYFVHSYAMPADATTLASCDHGMTFAAISGHRNFFGCQFHPERSGALGSRILRNFLAV